MTFNINRFMILATTIALTSCCSLPIMDCIVKTKELSIVPKITEFDNDLIKSCTVKAWILSSRNTSYDTATLDVALNFLYSTSINLDTINPASIFVRDSCYLKIGEEKFFFETDRVIKRAKQERKSKYSQAQIEYHLSSRITKKITKNNPGSLVISNLNFGNRVDSAINFKTMLYEK